MKESVYQVLLYYTYIPLSEPTQVMHEQKALCQKLGLKGRIIVAPEGINGTVEGSITQTNAYMHAMQKDERFSDVVFKKSVGTGNAFSKLSVKVRSEIVTAKLSKENVLTKRAKYITADTLHQWFEEKREFYVVDMRNDYEYQSGYFEGSLFSGLRNFFELSSVPARLQQVKNKTVVTVCTGGVRCEKASGLLVSEGFSDVYQLQDGIHTYLEKYPNSHFKGKLYVFDNRLTLGFQADSPRHEVVGKCFHCDKPCDTYVNCEYNVCHYHYIACKDCEDKQTGLYFCKQECKTLYQKTQNKHKRSFSTQQV